MPRSMVAAPLATFRKGVRYRSIAGSFPERRRLRDSGIGFNKECPALPLTFSDGGRDADRARMPFDGRRL
jgi:hypothetical protein